ncbi:YraN family protein [Thermodesulfatator atlanticus]|uniref:YraN family protein n=1 Tax=Thermodesulfatator atlanticus TaxID=501497 RepID=UPI00048E6C98|nr:YraN family protein [Thermodesulfatator atlanticus]
MGSFAEKLAVWYFRLKGYHVCAKNWRTRFGELDLVVKKGKTLVFVEVKARRSLRKGSPEEALTPAKKKKILSLAKLYLQKEKPKAQVLRFDLIAVDFSGEKPQLRHYQGVIEDDYQT